MRLLVDTDAFCKLAIGNLLAEAVSLLGAELGECGRLPALPHMLRRGRLHRTYGADACQRCIPLAERMPTVGEPSGLLLDRLIPIPAIDPGEALLFASAAERGLPVLSGDVRGLSALKDVEGFAELLSGRIVVMEAVLLGLCRNLGADVVRQRTAPIQATDAMIRICFSPDEATPEDGLRSYLRDRKNALAPLVLWDAEGEAE